MCEEVQQDLPPFERQVRNVDADPSSTFRHCAIPLTGENIVALESEAGTEGARSLLTSQCGWWFLLGKAGRGLPPLANTRVALSRPMPFLNARIMNRTLLRKHALHVYTLRLTPHPPNPSGQSYFNHKEGIAAPDCTGRTRQRVTYPPHPPCSCYEYGQ